jgi:hypothetical protein
LLLEFELELLLEFELELLLEFELELLLEFELELLLELELPPSPSSLSVRLLRNWVPPPALGGAERSTPGPTARLKKPNGPSSAAAGNAMAPVDSKAAAKVFLRRISVPSLLAGPPRRGRSAFVRGRRLAARQFQAGQEILAKL